MKNLVIVGAGGHTRTLLNILHLNGFNIKCIYDENLKDKNEKILNIPVKLISSITSNAKVIISKGDVIDKINYSKQWKNQLFKENLIHPNALIETLYIGWRNQISANVYATPTSNIGNDNVIYSGSIIEHESTIGNYNILTVNVSVCGRVSIADNCYIGAGAVILPNVSICSNVTIGAGAVVIKNIDEQGVYVGIPAKKVQK